MREILFVHPNFPGQFVHVLREMLRRGGWRIWALGGDTACAAEDAAFVDAMEKYGACYAEKHAP